ncbi:MAG: ATPase domain-containing protein [Eubacteriales bacterium]
MSTLNDVLQDKINKIKDNKNIYSMGKVSLVRDYIIEATGLEGVAYFEKVRIGQYNEGYVDAINKNNVVIALTKKVEKVAIGDMVVTTGVQFMAHYSEDSIGHVIDIFAEDKLSGRIFENTVDVPIEMEAIPIMARSTVNRPLHTGITGIDMLYPIGRGQRQLIIGDRKTGKTQIALDTIYNQAGQDILCIYVAIGKTKKEIKDLYAQLLKRGAMEYTMIIAAFNDESAPVLRNTPYAALSIAGLYLKENKDVLVVIDDLKRHADVCREMALLMGKTPGRDAYPPDIFYSHSRLLELGCQHKDGGSITILPICETKAGDITDYISTNIISITDGQIVLSAKNFEKGQKPAINYGLSVSRLGGAVQTQEIKQIGPGIRRELLSYLEQKEIFELANADEMGESMKRLMDRGARISKMLNQHKFAVKTTSEMISMVTTLNGGR